MITVVDVETSFVTGVNGKSDPSPFDSRNKLVSVGINDEYLFFRIWIYNLFHRKSNKKKS
jgi:hypothetical protein